MRAVRNIFIYIKGTLDYALFYKYGDTGPLTSCADADFARDGDTRRSTSRILHKLGDSPVDWCSKRQLMVALSTTKAKYCVLTEAARDIVHLLTHRTGNMRRTHIVAKCCKATTKAVSS